MDIEEILEHCESLSEDELTEKVIVPLYKKRFKGQFHDIEYSGKNKQEDQGIDVTYYERDAATGAKQYAGVQVKMGNINTGTGQNGVAALVIQANQAFKKPIPNIDDKKSYRIAKYTILCTGEATAKARTQIVEQLEHHPVFFTVGKTLAKWIQEDFEDEFEMLFPPDASEESEEDDETPAEVIANYLRENHSSDTAELVDGLAPLDKFQRRIVIAIMVIGGGKETAIAREMDASRASISDELKDLVGEDVLTVDEDGYSLGDLHNTWMHLRSAIEERRELLGYDEADVPLPDVIAALL